MDRKPAGWLPDASDEATDRLFVSALARGLEILRTFRPSDGVLGNLEIARRTGLPSATVSRLTYTLTKLGYLEHLPRLGKYQLGPAVLALGYAAYSDLDIRRRARPVMDEFAKREKVNVGLATPDRLDMLYIESCRETGSMMHRLEAGSRIPMATTAMGRAYLAGIGAAERDFLMRRIEETAAADWRRLAKEIENALASVAKRGFCVTNWQPDIIAAGVPMRGPNGPFRYAMNVGGPTFLIGRDRLETDLAPRLVSLVRNLERELGFA
ncbi:MAG: IclR family transcriptional regulator [Hyphomicrobiaceae bacterium]|nr:MAG: IclR family transcriptional regulator [Hyphomicrobiaceae bacterium]